MDRQNKLMVGMRSLLCASVMVILVIDIAPVMANQEQSGWDKWQAIGQGYVARRRVPPNFNKTISERKLLTVSNRNAKPVNGGSSQGQEVGQFQPNIQGLLSATAIVDAVSIKTQGEGLFSISIADLAILTGRSQADIIKSASRRRLTLTNNDQAVRWMYYPDTQSILFFGKKFETFYTAENAYRLTFGRTSKSKRITISRATDGPTDGNAHSFTETLSFEEEPDLYFDTGPAVAQEPNIDYWFWDFLFAGSVETIDVPIVIESPVSTGTAQIKINMRGATSLEAENEHEVHASINGQSPIGTSSVVWDGFNNASLEIEVNQSDLFAGENTLTLSGVYASGVTSIQYLDDIELEYQRMPIAEQGKLLLSDVQLQDDQLVTGFTTDQILVIQNPNGNPVARRDVTIFEEVDGSFSVAFNTKTSSEYLVTQVDSMLSVASLEEDVESNLASSSNAIDYLIIAPRTFTQTANELQLYRQADFANIQIAWLDDIYDEFSAGRVDPFALTSFLTYAQSNWSLSPSNVVILGKASLDHKDRMGYGDSFVPTVMTDTPWALAASDDRLLAGDTNTAGFAIGRIPMTSDSQGLAYIDKLKEYDLQVANATELNGVLIADNADEAGDFVANSEQVAQDLLGIFGFTSVQKEYHPSTPTVSSQMLLDSTWETSLVSYDGHGSTQQVGNSSEDFILASNAASLTNNSYPVFAALTCAAGNFINPGVTSLASALVLNPNGGAAVSYAPTGLSLDSDAQTMANEFFSSLYGSGNRIGQSVLDAKTNTASNTQLFMRRIYSVVGDPAAYAR